MWYLKLKSISALLVLLVTSVTADLRNTLVVEGSQYYYPTVYPDRIITLATENPATSITVNWRTDTSVTKSEAQIAIAKASPALDLPRILVSGSSMVNKGHNGPAKYHTVTFKGLEPGTLYAYRVRGGGTWSEWFQIKTAANYAEPFSFFYFGDAQNAIKSHFSRVIRQAFKDMPEASLMVHAGDMVNSREGNHDDEWGEWFDAGKWMYGMIPSVMAAGNHEHEKILNRDSTETYKLPDSWFAQFRVPQNGPKELLGTVYYFDYQGVRFIVLNSLSALDGTAELQAKWLDQILKKNPNRWTVVAYHHPMFSVSVGRDNPLLRTHWKPIFDKYRVDLVLQGHDHTYGRGSNVTEGAHVKDNAAGTMYVVSVSGPKMYLVSDTARATMKRVGEDLQLYQLISVDHNRIQFEAKTATGELYDSFTITKDSKGRNSIKEVHWSGAKCSRPLVPDELKPRCWNGNEVIEIPDSFR
jgi:hypothetical protein